MVTLGSPGSQKTAGGLEGHHGEILDPLASNEGTGAKTPSPASAAVCHSWEETPNLILLKAGLSRVMPGRGDGWPPGTVSDTGAQAGTFIRSRGSGRLQISSLVTGSPQKSPSWAPEAIAQDSIGEPACRERARPLGKFPLSREAVTPEFHKSHRPE